MYYIIDKITQAEWAELRKQGVGASEINILLGINKYGDTPYKLYRRKIGLDPGMPENAITRDGHDLEPIIAKHFCEMTGASLKRGTDKDWLAVDTTMPYLRVSPDRLFWAAGDKHSKKNLRILELKNTSNYIDRDCVPESWKAQVQYQMGVMGIKKACLCWRSNYTKVAPVYGFIEFEFEPEYYERIKQAATEFWTRHVIPRIEPPLTSSDDANIKFKNPKDASVIATADIKETLCQIKIIREKIKKNEDEKKIFKATEDRLELILKSFMGDDYNAITDEDGNVLSSWKQNEGKKSFNKEKFQTEQPEIYAQYETKGSPYRTLRLSNAVFHNE